MNERSFISAFAYLCDELAKCEALEFSHPSGGMFILADVSRTGLGGEGFTRQLLVQEKVAVVPGFGFGSSMTDTVRIGFFFGQDRLREAEKRIARFATGC